MEFKQETWVCNFEFGTYQIVKRNNNDYILFLNPGGSLERLLWVECPELTDVYSLNSLDEAVNKAEEHKNKVEEIIEDHREMNLKCF